MKAQRQIQDFITKSNVPDKINAQKPLNVSKLDRNLGNVDIWLKDCEEIISLSKMLLKLESPSFWSTLVYSKWVAKLYNNCLELFASDSVKHHLNSSNYKIIEALQQIYRYTFLVFMRMMMESKYKDSQISVQMHNEILCSYRLLEIEDLMKISFIYGSTNALLLSKAFSFLLTVKAKYNMEFDQLMERSKNFTQNISDQLEKVFEIMTKSKNDSVTKSKENDSDYILTLLNSGKHLYLLLLSFIKIWPLAISSEALKDLINNLPNFLTTLFTELNDVDIPFICGNNTKSMRNVLRCRSIIAQLIMHVFEVVYHGLSDDDKMKLIFNNLGHKEFLVRLDDTIDLSTELTRFQEISKVSNIEHVQIIRRSLCDAYNSRALAKKDSLLKQGKLQFIGNPPNKYIADSIHDLADLMPGITSEQLHLCLRNFGYNTEEATHALCEKSLLPLDLRCLLRSESNILVASTLTGITIPSLDDSDDFEDANSTSMGIDSNGDIGTSIQPLIDLQLASTKYEGGVGVDQKYLNSEGPTDKDLSKLMEKYGNRANISITELNTIADTIRFEKEKREIEIGGKLMMRKDFIKNESMQPSETEKLILKSKTKLLGEIQSEDEDEEVISESELSGDDKDDKKKILTLEMRRQLKEEIEDRKIASKYGQSGRFNHKSLQKPTSSNVSKRNFEYYDDESDDDYYESCEEHTPDSGINASNKVGLQRSCGVSEGKEYLQKKNGQPKTQQDKTTLKGDNHAKLKGKKTIASEKGAPKINADVQKYSQSKLEPPPGFENLGKVKDDRHQPNTSKSDSRGGTSSRYTGGRTRQIKEKHKSDKRQRGADKKTRGGNPF